MHYSLGGTRAEDVESPGTVEADLGADVEGSRTDDNVVAREEEAIKLDGLNVAQVRLGYEECAVYDKLDVK